MDDRKRSRWGPGEGDPAAPAPVTSSIPYEDFVPAVLSRSQLAKWANSPLLPAFIAGGFVCVSGRNISSSWPPDLLLCRVVCTAPPATEEYPISSADGKEPPVHTRAKIAVSLVQLSRSSSDTVPVRLSLVSNQALPPGEYARALDKLPEMPTSLPALYAVLDSRDRLAAAAVRGRFATVSVDGAARPWGECGSASLLLRSWLHSPTLPTVAVPASPTTPPSPRVIHTVDVSVNKDLERALAAWPAIGPCADRPEEAHVSQIFRPVLAHTSADKFAGEFVFLFLVSACV